MAVKDAMSAAATTLIAMQSTGGIDGIVAPESTTTHHKTPYGGASAMVMPTPGFMGAGKSTSLSRPVKGGAYPWEC